MYKGKDVKGNKRIVLIYFSLSNLLIKVNAIPFDLLAAESERTNQKLMQGLSLLCVHTTHAVGIVNIPYDDFVSV